MGAGWLQFLNEVVRSRAASYWIAALLERWMHLNELRLPTALLWAIRQAHHGWVLLKLGPSRLLNYIVFLIVFRHCIP